MTQEELNEVLEKHLKWLKGEADGKKANLNEANLNGADLNEADLRGANIDYSCWPLWCGSLKVHIDDRIGIQLLYHAIAPILYSKNTSVQLKKEVSALIETANRFHRVEECGRLEGYKDAE